MYGNAPKDLGLIDLSPTEMMFWLYCPIKTPGKQMETYPPNLRQFWPIVSAVDQDLSSAQWDASYIYLTAKTLWVSPGNAGNRLGWHTDGFGTNDLNYVWCTANPTIFWVPPVNIELPEDHTKSMELMTAFVEEFPHHQKRYPLKHLLRLDQTVIHAVDPVVQPGMRSFVKVSVSDKPYALEGNSVNHALNLNWTYAPRAAVRNCPQSSMKDHA